MLPSQYRIDYEGLLATAQREDAASIVQFLRKQLPVQWRNAYLAAAVHQANLFQFQRGSFEYICDLYSQLEAAGEVAFNQTIQDRVVAVLGTSARQAEQRNAARKKIWFDPSELFGERDQGHFMARSIGGGPDVNVFWQDRSLNRGWSLQGKLFRKMETYCYEQPETFCFSRPIYTDGSCIPRWLEFGLLRSDQSLWVEVFDN